MSRWQAFKNKWVWGCALGLLLVVAIITNGVPLIYSDGFGSYHITHCLLSELNFTCKQQPEYYPDYTYHTVQPYSGEFVTVYAPGAALVNLPGQVIANLIEPERSSFNEYFTSLNGHTFSQGVAFLLTSVALHVASWWLMYKSLLNFGFSPRLSLFSVAVTYLSSYAVWYMLLSPGFNHSPEIFALSLFCYGVSMWMGQGSTKGIVYTALGGGLAVLSRPPLAIVVITWGLYLLIKKQWKALRYYVLAGLPLALIYLIYNKVSYDAWFVSSYALLFDQDFTFSAWHGFELLFSQYRGWFVYSPLFLFSLLGLFLWGRASQRLVSPWLKEDKGKGVAVVLLVPIVFTAILYGFWPVWWGGNSYGQRFLISFVPFLAVGTAALISIARKYQLGALNLRKWALAIVTACTLFSMLITLLYRLTPVGELRPVTDAAEGMSSGDRYTIPDIFSYHSELLRESASVSEYMKKLYGSVSGGASILPFLLQSGNHVVRVDDREFTQLKLVILSAAGAKQPLPPDIQVGIFDEESRQFTKYLWRPATGSLTFVCDMNRCAPDLEIIERTDYFREEFSLTAIGNTAIRVAGRPYVLTFPDYDSVFFKGDLINLPPGELEFVF